MGNRNAAGETNRSTVRTPTTALQLIASRMVFRSAANQFCEAAQLLCALARLLKQQSQQCKQKLRLPDRRRRGEVVVSGHLHAVDASIKEDAAEAGEQNKKRIRSKTMHDQSSS